MNLDNLTIGEAKKLAAMFGGAASAGREIIAGGLRPVIVRSRDAGVQFGYLVEYDASGATVTLRDARQMWQWEAAKGGSLLDCANHGVTPANCKFSDPCSRIVVIGACAIIDVSSAAVASFGAGKWA